MKSVGIDIGTTSVSAVVMNNRTGGIERSWTIPNPGFLTSGRAWERLQDADAIVRTTRRLLDEILDGEPDVRVIGLTGQMHGIVYLDRAGRAVSPLMTWQDITDTSSVFFSKRKENRLRTASIRAILPEKMKKNTKVKSKG